MVRVSRVFKSGLVFWFMALLIPLMLTSQLVWSASDLVKIYPKSIMLGERLTLTINGNAALRDFDKLDLTELKKRFAINEVDVSSDQIRLRLYPISAGLLEIPEIKTGAIHIPLTPIEVRPNPDVKLLWQAPKANSYQSENLLWNVTVKLKNDANQARFQVRENPNWQVNLNPQPVLETLDAQTGKTAVLVANYQFEGGDDFGVTQTATNHVIESPAVVVKNTTNRRWLFFDQPHTINVLPLPSFLPVNVAVGSLQLQTESEGVFKVSGDLNYWVWQLEGLGVDELVLQNMAHQLIGQMAHNETLEWLSESREAETTITEQGLNSALTVRLPYRIIQAGLFTLPELNLRYFDVETGKLISQTFTAHTQFAMPIWLLWMLQWLGLIIVLTLLYGALWQIKQAWLNWQLRQAIQKASNPQQLIEAMFKWQTKQSKVSRPASLKQFQDWYENRFGASELLQDLISSLNERLYAPSISETNWPVMKQQASDWSKTRRFSLNTFVRSVISQRSITVLK